MSTMVATSAVEMATAMEMSSSVVVMVATAARAVRSKTAEVVGKDEGLEFEDRARFEARAAGNLFDVRGVDGGDRVGVAVLRFLVILGSTELVGSLNIDVGRDLRDVRGSLVRHHLIALTDVTQTPHSEADSSYVLIALTSRNTFFDGRRVDLIKVVELLRGTQDNLIAVEIDVRDAEVVLTNAVDALKLTRELGPRGRRGEGEATGEAVGQVGDLEDGVRHCGCSERMAEPTCEETHPFLYVLGSAATTSHFWVGPAVIVCRLQNDRRAYTAGYRLHSEEFARTCWNIQARAVLAESRGASQFLETTGV